MKKPFRLALTVLLLLVVLAAGWVYLVTRRPTVQIVPGRAYSFPRDTARWRADHPGRSLDKLATDPDALHWRGDSTGGRQVSSPILH